MRLLIAEDDPRLLKSLKHIFTCNNYLVDAVADGAEALAYAETGEYDGLVLDVMMPKLDGITVLERLRAAGISTPALLLTARSETSQRVEGLDAGADDYLTKPFATAELLARVRAMLRRKDTYTPDLLSACGLGLDRATFTLHCEEKSQPLSSKEYQIIELLMTHPGQIIKSDTFMNHIWGWNSDASISTLWVHISNIRKKLQALDAPATIRFVRNVGYILEATS